MRATHELKTWPAPFQLVWDGVKRYEVRPADRGFKVGDSLFLREWEPDAKRYTGRGMVVLVTCMTGPREFGLDDDTCVLGIQPDLTIGGPGRIDG